MKAAAQLVRLETTPLISPRPDLKVVSERTTVQREINATRKTVTIEHAEAARVLFHYLKTKGLRVSEKIDSLKLTALKNGDLQLEIVEA